jgi:protein-S-isoprenylcysteine O-methyltransferase Ste14
MNKVTSFLFGVFSYLVFFASFVYAIGFLAELHVPKSINSGETSGFTSSLLINLTLLSLFAVQHSLMARPFFKRWFTRYVPIEIERSIYVLASSLLLLLLYWLWQPMPDLVWKVDSALGQFSIWVVFVIGWLIVFLSTFMINHFDLLGLRQVWLHLRDRPYESIPFQTRALYRFVRHPIMLGFIVAFWATPTMTQGHLLFSLMTTLYIVVAIQFEEHDLRNALGADYEHYQKSVPMLFPRKPRSDVKQ